MERHPWLTLPRDLAEVLSPELPALAAETIAELSTGVPEYARPLEGPFGVGLRNGVEAALRGFVDEIGGEADPDPASRQVYVDLGRGEMRAGRSLEALLAAYRLGARVAWRRLAAAGVRAATDPDTLYLLAESIFAFIDELSAESVEGYALEQSEAADERARRRRRLVQLAIQSPPADPVVVQAAALEAGWELPVSLAALVLEGDGADAAARRLGPAALAARVGEVVCALISDPDAPGRRAELEVAAAGHARAALGHVTGWADARVSFERAGALLALERDGLVDPAPLLLADEHAAALLIATDRRLAADLAASRLAPLDELAPATRERLEQTLTAWLARQGRLAPTAADLGVHVQTVRYRLAQLREHLGDALEDPDARFELELALRARRTSAA